VATPFGRYTAQFAVNAIRLWLAKMVTAPGVTESSSTALRMILSRPAA